MEARIFRLARPYLGVRDNERHTLNAVGFCLSLIPAHDADRGVVVPAMILHDVGWSKVSEEVIKKACRPEPDRELVGLHEKEGVRIAERILGEAAYEGAGKKEILEIIDGHDTRSAPLSVNDAIVKDADKLTRYAASFWFWTRQLPMAPEELARTLGGLIDTWFFLPGSKDMARAELARRYAEMDGACRP